jgi:hypothetical protein
LLVDGRIRIRILEVKTYGFESGSGRLLKTQGNKLVLFFCLIKTEVITGSGFDPDSNLVRLIVPRKGKMMNFHAMSPLAPLSEAWTYCAK